MRIIADANQVKLWAKLSSRQGQTGAPARQEIGCAAMLDMVLSIVMLAAVALAAGSVYLFRKGDTKRATLMAVLVVVMLVNIVIWTVPSDDGDALREHAATQ